MDEHCTLCISSASCLSRSEKGPSQQELYELFHLPCSACSVLDSQADSLCDFCQHLRLRHLVRCVKPETRNRFEFFLRKGQVDNAIRTGCALCRLVDHIILVGLSAAEISEMRKSNCDIVLDEALPEDSQSEGSSVFSAEVWAKFSEGVEVAYNWVGDIHINDIKSGKAFHPFLCA